MGTPGGQMPKFGEKRTPNYRYYANNTKSPHDCIQYKAWWDLFKLNGKIVGPLYDHLGGRGKYTNFHQEWPQTMVLCK